MKMTCYALRPDPLPLRPASVSRDWMDRIPNRHAYRCLPLNIANSHGWEIGAPCDLEISWDGGPHAFNLKVATAWKARCDEFMKRFRAREPETLKEARQRYYFLGKMPDGSAAEQHVDKLRVNAPVDRRGQRVEDTPAPSTET